MLLKELVALSEATTDKAEIAKKQKKMCGELLAAAKPYLKDHSLQTNFVGAHNEGFSISAEPTSDPNDPGITPDMAKQIKKELKVILDKVADGRKYEISYHSGYRADMVIRVPRSAVMTD